MNIKIKFWALLSFIAVSACPLEQTFAGPFDECITDECEKKNGKLTAQFEAAFFDPHQRDKLVALEEEQKPLSTKQRAKRKDQLSKETPVTFQQNIDRLKALLALDEEQKILSPKELVERKAQIFREAVNTYERNIVQFSADVQQASCPLRQGVLNYLIGISHQHVALTLSQLQTILPKGESDLTLPEKHKRSIAGQVSHNYFIEAKIAFEKKADFFKTEEGLQNLLRSSHEIATYAYAHTLKWLEEFTADKTEKIELLHDLHRVTSVLAATNPAGCIQGGPLFFNLRYSDFFKRTVAPNPVFKPLDPFIVAALLSPPPQGSDLKAVCDSIDSYRKSLQK